MRGVTERAGQRVVPIPADQAGYLIGTAARAPSVHNTQPWRFRVGQYAIELYADQRRKLRVDPVGREMLISCGAALFGLRLAVRSLGYVPVVELLPDPARLRLLARVSMGAAAPMTARERQLLEALPHRHTHRGPFAGGPLPAGLAAGLQHDAVAEGATLVLVDRAIAYQKLAEVVGAAARRLDLDPAAQAEVRRWSRVRPIPLATASLRARSPPPLAVSLGGCHSGISTWAAAWACWPLAGRRPPPPRCCSRLVMAGPTGCGPARRCTGCWHTRRANGYSRACIPSRWKPARSVP